MILLDTHAWVWSLTDDPRLSQRARSALNKADVVFVSPISFFEIGQTARIGKWPEMERYIPDLPTLLEQQGGRVAPLTPKSCLQAATMQWEHRDPFDRILAATALELGVGIVTADAIFDSLQGVRRIW